MFTYLLKVAGGIFVPNIDAHLSDYKPHIQRMLKYENSIIESGQMN
jgi:hypothetical protein